MGRRIAPIRYESYTISYFEAFESSYIRANVFDMVLEHFPIKLTDILLWRRNFCIRLG